MMLTCATTNRGKFREFLRAYPNIEMLRGMSGLPPSPENGSTFEENAVEKARYYSHHARGLLFTDDSGLEVEALGGAPGIHSARFAGETATDTDNKARLLQEMQKHDDRRARFVCVLALACHGELIGTFRGEVAGEILREPRGTEGFGYDPLFFLPSLQKTMAELTEDQKFAISHRGQAFQQLIHGLSRIVKPT